MQASFLDVPKEICQKADLHCSNGNSDKVYHTTIEQKDGGYVVLFAYGRRGDTLTRGTKTQEPVPYEKAIGVFNRLVSEKTAKGYISTPGISGDVSPSVRAQTLSSPEPLNTKKKMADVVAQLLTPITEDDAEGYLSDSAYGAQEKKDGKRLLVKSNGTDDIIVLNRNSVIIETSPYIKNAVLSLGREVLLDGEAIGDVYHVFGLLELDGDNLRSWPYKSAHEELKRVVRKDKTGNMKIVPYFLTESSKRKLFKDLKSKDKEGIVFKHISSVHFPGRGPLHVKCKFFSTASIVVLGVNVKRSIKMGVFDGKTFVFVGNVTIPANYEIPAKGDVCEVRYLYAYRNGSLFQPTYLGTRDDIEASECSQSQLKYVNKEDA